MKEPEIDDLKKLLKDSLPLARWRRTPARPVAGDATTARSAHVARALVGLGVARDPYCGALLFPGNHSRVVVPPVRKE